MKNYVFYFYVERVRILAFSSAVAKRGQPIGRIRELLQKNRQEGLTQDEVAEWKRYELVEHLVRMAKGRAKTKLGVA